MLADQPDDTRAFLLERTLLAFSKSGTRSQVHRPAYPDYIAVKRFNAAGEVVGEQGFLGLYTSNVYTERPDLIPLLRKKVANIRRRSGLDPDGFDGKILAHVLASYPRDELFQSSEDELFANAMAITQIHERRRTRVFLRRDRYGLFYTCLVFMPRELYNTQLRVRIQKLLMATLGAEDAPFDAYFSESILVRLQFVIRVPPGTNGPVDIDELQRSIVALTRDWSQDVRQALLQECGEVDGRRLAEAYLDKLPAGYRENRSPRAAVADIQEMERLSEQRNLTMRLYRGPEDPEDMFFARVFHLGEPLPLSELVPALEHMGVRAIGEHPYRIDSRRINGSSRTISIHDLELVRRTSHRHRRGGGAFRGNVRAHLARHRRRRFAQSPGAGRRARMARSNRAARLRALHEADAVRLRTGVHQRHAVQASRNGAAVDAVVRGAFRSGRKRRRNCVARARSSSASTASSC